MVLFKGPDKRVEMRQLLAVVWRGWISLGEKLGNLQIILLLSLAYWTIGLLSAIPMKLFSDRLSLKKNSKGWKTHKSPTDIFTSMRKQGGEESR
tara:strand:+ start:1492 stop:1773 length:282 start_codon:yes stop_codon:yes gene_type:complete